MIGKLLGDTQIQTSPPQHAHRATDPVRSAADAGSSQIAASLQEESTSLPYLDYGFEGDRARRVASPGKVWHPLTITLE